MIKKQNNNKKRTEQSRLHSLLNAVSKDSPQQFIVFIENKPYAGVWTLKGIHTVSCPVCSWPLLWLYKHKLTHMQIYLPGSLTQYWHPSSCQALAAARHYWQTFCLIWLLFSFSKCPAGTEWKTHTHTHELKDNQSSVTFFKQSVATGWPAVRRSAVRIPSLAGKIWMVGVNEWHSYLPQ